MLKNVDFFCNLTLLYPRKHKNESLGFYFVILWDWVLTLEWTSAFLSQGLMESKAKNLWKRIDESDFKEREKATLRFLHPLNTSVFLSFLAD